MRQCAPPAPPGRAPALFAEIGMPHMVEKLDGLLHDAGCPEAGDGA